MSQSGRLSTKQIAMAAGAVVVLVLSAVWVKNSMSAPAESAVRQAYFYDLTSGSLFSDLAVKMPPIDAPGGTGKGVRAHVFGCESCAETKIVYLETFTQDARRYLNDPVEGMPPDTVERGTLVAVVPEKPGDEVEWFNGLTTQNVQIRALPEQLCRGKTATRCTPDMK